MGFVARRLLAERIVMVFAVREPSHVPELDGLPDLVVTGLPVADARLLPAAVVPGRLDELWIESWPRLRAIPSPCWSCRAE